MAEHAAVINVSRYRPTAGKRQELVAAMRQIAEQAVAAKGCFGAQVCESDLDPEELVGISRWESAQALKAFSDAAASTSQRERFRGLVTGAAKRENLSPI